MKAHDWLKSFMRQTEARPDNSCSCSGDCDKERHAAYVEILALRLIVEAYEACRVRSA